MQCKLPRPGLDDAAQPHISARCWSWPVPSPAECGITLGKNTPSGTSLAYRDGQEAQGGTSVPQKSVTCIKFTMDTFIPAPTKSVPCATEFVLISVHIYGILAKVEKNRCRWVTKNHWGLQKALILTIMEIFTSQRRQIKGRRCSSTAKCIIGRSPGNICSPRVVMEE